jgi:thioesterase domain-containing protein/acyl carrier protein
MARGATPDDKYLAAYVVASAGVQLTSLDLKEFMRKRLPEYMIPAVFIFLDALPLNPNGKVNRLALPEPDTVSVNGQFPSGKMAEPRNPVETTIARIWKDALKLERVGIHDNFFDIGGHSLMAVRVLTRIERELGVRLPLTSFLHSATIAQLAELVDCREDEAQSWAPLVAIQPHGTKTPFFGIHPVEGGVLFWKDVVMYMPDDRPFYAVQAQGVDGIRPAVARIEDMARMYVAEIQKVQPHGPYYLGGYSLGGEIAFEMAQQFSKLGEPVALLVLFDTRNPVRSIRPVRMEGSRVIPVLDAQIPKSWLGVLKTKVAGHSWRIRQFAPAKAVKYISKLAAFHAQFALVTSIAKGFRLLHKRPPDNLLDKYLKSIHGVALRNYVPTVYPGKITLFHANESERTNPVDAPMGWAPLAGGGLEVHYFDTPHAMLRPEYVEQVALKLNECILVAEGH